MTKYSFQMDRSDEPLTLILTPRAWSSSNSHRPLQIAQRRSTNGLLFHSKGELFCHPTEELGQQRLLALKGLSKQAEYPVPEKP